MKIKITESVPAKDVPPMTLFRLYHKGEEIYAFIMEHEEYANILIDVTNNKWLHMSDVDMEQFVYMSEKVIGIQVE